MGMDHGLTLVGCTVRDSPRQDRPRRCRHSGQMRSNPEETSRRPRCDALIVNPITRHRTAEVWVCLAHLHGPGSPPPRERHHAVFSALGALGSLDASGRAFA